MVRHVLKEWPGHSLKQLAGIFPIVACTDHVPKVIAAETRGISSLAGCKVAGNNFWSKRNAACQVGG